MNKFKYYIWCIFKYAVLKQRLNLLLVMPTDITVWLICFRICLLRESGLYGKWSEDILSFKKSYSMGSSGRKFMGKNTQQILVDYKPLSLENLYGLGLLYIVCTLVSIVIILLEVLFNFFSIKF